MSTFIPFEKIWPVLRLSLCKTEEFIIKKNPLSFVEKWVLFDFMAEVTKDIIESFHFTPQVKFYREKKWNWSWALSLATTFIWYPRWKVNFYRRFIKNFSKIVKSLCNLLGIEIEILFDVDYLDFLFD